MDIKRWANSRYNEQVVPPARRVYKSTLEILEKAKDPSVWDSFFYDASGNYDYGADKVDPSVHLSSAKKFPEYMQALNDPDQKVDHPHFGEGASSKMLHHYKDDSYMMKPYHNNPSFLTGWNSMAVNGLFNKAGLSGMIEDIGTHEVEHQGAKIPVNVSKFSKNYTVRGDLNAKPVVDLKDVSKIALMDYLVDNIDRHDSNIMISNDLNESGYNDILAIDHDLSFDYGRYGTQASDNPADHYAPRAFEGLGEPESLNHEDIKHLALWWQNSSPKLKIEIMDHLKAIKDDSIKKHIHQNFYKRAEALDEWANKAVQDPGSHNPFSGMVGDVGHVPMDFQGDFDFGVLGRLSELADEDPVKAFSDAINDLQSRSYNEDFGLSLGQSLSDYLGKMKPSEVADLFMAPMTTPAAKSFKTAMVTSLLNKASKGDRSHVGILNYLKSVNDKQPDNQKFFNPIWSFAINQVIS